MSAPMVANLCLIYLFYFTYYTINAHDELERVITTLDKYIKFHLKDKNSITPDILFSLRVIEGNVVHLTSNVDASSLTIDPYQLEEIGSLKVDVNVLTSLAFSKLQQTEVVAVKQMWNILNQPWGVRKPYKVIDPKYKWSGRNKAPIDPIEHANKLSKCLTYLTERKRHNPSEQFSVEEKCVHPMMMLAEDTEAEALMAQIQYYTYAEIYGFAYSLNKMLYKKGIRGGIEEMEMKLCSNAFFMVKDSIKDRRLTDVELYVELGLLCASHGFMQFLHMDWLDMLIQWQLPQGCFNARFNGKYGECEHHVGAGAASLLSQYLVFLAQPGPLMYRGIVALQGHNHLAEDVDVPEEKLVAINGDLLDVGKLYGYQTNFNAFNTERSVSGIGTTAILGVMFCFVLVGGTILAVVRSSGKHTDDNWTLPTTSRYGKRD